MKLAIFNGSPRAKTSNTKKLLDFFQKGFENAGGEITSVDYLIQEKHVDEQVRHFLEAQNILLAFPLYVDSLPGVVKQFIEKIGNIDGRGKRIYFFVHSGFPEAVHCEALVRYLKLLTKRWNMEYGGTILKPGTEQIHMRPEKKNENLFHDFETLGSKLATTEIPDQSIVEKFKKHYVFPKRAIPLIKLLVKLGVFDLFWKREMEKNKALARSFDMPLSQ